MTWAKYWRTGQSITGRWLPAGVTNGTTLSTGVPSADVIRAAPLMPAAKGGITITALAMWQSGAGAGNARMGLYSNKANGDLYPDALLADFGELAIAGAGVNQWSGSVAVAVGDIVWVAHIADFAPLVGIWGTGQNSLAFGYPSTLGNTASGSLVTKAQTYGALPATFPAAGTIPTGTWLAMFYQTG